MTSATNVSTQISNIPMLNGSNFKVWKDIVEIVLGCMDLDIALREEKPTSTLENLSEVKIEKCERSNRIKIMIMKRSIPEARGSITEDKDAKQFLKDVKKFLARNEKAEDCLWSRSPSDAERYIYVADGNIVGVEAI
ncbi:uncharacterized protein LOC127742812 [Arachis duranensis]|uniref:Uncharacterized protein LOC127742812 n=1 Tax=Arachis duranensis TaxID=130453 RepID=A0A9C6WRB8_ARADU|nr:uncharacterized protein LOC127742812 [Arachis duranensis]